MENSTRVNEILDQCGLNWTVRTEGIQSDSGIILPGKALIREDNNKPLSTHGEGYEVFQNHELIELLDKVSNQMGLPIHTGGSFGDGARVFIQLKSNDLKLGNDRVEGYVTGVNSFDGSTSLGFGPSNITISCGNTFFGAYRGLNSKVRHTKNMTIRIEDVLRRLEGVLDEEKKMFDNIVKMSETRYNKGVEETVIKALFNLDKAVNLSDLDSVSTVTQNKLSRFYVDLNGEISGKGDNLWGLFSGITKYTTHSISQDSTRNQEGKMFGLYGNREREIFDSLVEMV